MRSAGSELDRRWSTTVQRISPGPDGASSASAGGLDSAQAAVKAISNGGRTFMFGLLDRTAAGTAPASMPEG
jgi:hypothetical protein